MSQQPEAGDYVTGQLIWGRLKGYDWWPGRVVSYNEAQKAPPSPSTHWVKWFGDNKLSMVCKIKILIFSSIFFYKQVFTLEFNVYVFPTLVL